MAREIQVDFEGQHIMRIFIAIAAVTAALIANTATAHDCAPGDTAVAKVDTQDVDQDGTAHKCYFGLNAKGQKTEFCPYVYKKGTRVGEVSQQWNEKGIPTICFHGGSCYLSADFICTPGKALGSGDVHAENGPILGFFHAWTYWMTKGECSYEFKAIGGGLLAPSISNIKIRLVGETEAGQKILDDMVEIARIGDSEADRYQTVYAATDQGCSVKTFTITSATGVVEGKRRDLLKDGLLNTEYRGDERIPVITKK